VTEVKAQLLKYNEKRKKYRNIEIKDEKKII